MRHFLRRNRSLGWLDALIVFTAVAVLDPAATATRHILSMDPLPSPGPGGGIGNNGQEQTSSCNPLTSCDPGTSQQAAPPCDPTIQSCSAGQPTPPPPPPPPPPDHAD